MELILKVKSAAPSCRLQQQHFELRAGVRDEDAVEYFGYCRCAHLASAFHERYGWPLVIATRESAAGPRSFLHMGAVMPDARVVDIFGIRPVEEFMEPLSAPRGLYRQEEHPSLAAWFELVGLPPSTRVSWWRTAASNPDAYERVVFAFADALLGAM